MDTKTEQIVLRDVQANTKKLKRQPKGCSIFLGVAQMCCAAVSIAFNGMAIHYGVSFTVISHGIWLPILWTVAGTFAIVAGCKKSTCWVKSSLVLNIVAVSLLSLYIALVITDIVYLEESEYYEGCFYSRYHSYDNGYGYYNEYVQHFDTCNWHMMRASIYMMLIACVAEFAFALTACIIGCRVCCQKTRLKDVVYTVKPHLDTNAAMRSIQASDSTTPSPGKYIIKDGRVLEIISTDDAKVKVIQK